MAGPGQVSPLCCVCVTNWDRLVRGLSIGGDGVGHVLNVDSDVEIGAAVRPWDAESTRVAQHEAAA